MLNTFKLNTTLLNDYPRPETGGLPNEAIRFGSFGLQNDNICISSADHWDTPEREFGTSPRPSRNGRIVTNDSWDSKDINLSGMLLAETAAELDAVIFNLKKALATQEQNLDLQLADGSYRRYKSTCVRADINRNQHYNITHAPFVLTFECVRPFGTETDASSFLYETSLTAFTEDIIAGGNVETLPFFVFIVESATDIDKIRITNNSSGRVIESSFEVSAGDVIIVDSEGYSVTHNFLEQDYTGVFPSLESGTNNLTIEMLSSDPEGSPAVSYSLTCKFYNSYL